LSEISSNRPATFLELGSGGGNNALHMKLYFASVTLVDLSEAMLAVSQNTNPDCEHLQGDMRIVRLNRTFDVVFVHDAVEYMTTTDELRQAIETASVHCKSGGIALFVPDTVREIFEPSEETGGSDKEGRSVRYFEWSYDPDSNDTTYITDYVMLVRENNQSAKVYHDQHVLGLHSQDQWVKLLDDAGFNAAVITDPYERRVFVAHKR
jgi:trans-aconitate methyltransferase